MSVDGVAGAQGRPVAGRFATLSKDIFAGLVTSIMSVAYGLSFAALIFAPPEADEASLGDDGFLSVHEIYRLPLRECELAVLSAWRTNVGPRQPLEAGVTIAGAFLAAGARNVVASHWSVEDESTAELMTQFFEELVKSDKSATPAEALHRARLRLRESRNWSSPFHWAPFVLLGTDR